MEELFVMWLYARNIRSKVTKIERMRRAWNWAGAFAAKTNSYACFILLSAVHWPTM